MTGGLLSAYYALSCNYRENLVYFSDYLYGQIVVYDVEVTITKSLTFISVKTSTSPEGFCYMKVESRAGTKAVDLGGRGPSVYQDGGAKV